MVQGLQAGDFYSHALARRDEESDNRPAITNNFYSHALARRDASHAITRASMAISTPTPSQGVTASPNSSASSVGISTPTPSQGVT